MPAIRHLPSGGVQIDVDLLIHEVEQEQPDTRKVIKEGDYIVLSDPHRGEGWRQGHVEHITDSGLLCIGYGGMTDTAYWRLHGASGPVLPEKVGEVWRQVTAVKRSSFEYEGRTVPVTSVESEWFKVV